ncbi:integrase [Streptomyces sp. NPDC005828]|uniref:integrase n=1 Tax=Streptomyces sp. NPDC005828 TaxID=3157071 RepID=UPI0034107C2E
MSGAGPAHAECARRAGQSIQALFQRYAKFLDGLQEYSNRLIEESMQDRSPRSEGSSPKG